MIVHASILTETQSSVLRIVGPAARRAGFYLAGGTALALRFGHRRSEDFDWFTSVLPRPDMLLANLQKQSVPIEKTQVQEGTVIGWVNAVKVSFFEYRYPLLDPFDRWNDYDTDIASVRDLGEMKLLAIAQRGSRKDFVDVYELLQNGVTLSSMLEDFREKFKTDSVSALRGLTYFDDAESEPMPTMLADRHWQSIRTTLQAAVRESVYGNS